MSTATYLELLPVYGPMIPGHACATVDRGDGARMRSKY
jgi:hypothetical protein